MATSTRLPVNYNLSQGGGKFLKFKPGTTKIRIMGNALVGYVDRTEKDGKKKPVRTQERPATSFDPDRPAKEFWAFVVYSYDDQDIMTCEITQNSIKQAIHTLYNDEDRGDPKSYDLKVTREGEGMETRYTVTPSNKGESKEANKAIAGYEVDMEVLFDNGEPLKKVQEVEFPTTKNSD